MSSCPYYPVRPPQELAKARKSGTLNGSAAPPPRTVSPLAALRSTATTLPSTRSALRRKPFSRCSIRDRRELRGPGVALARFGSRPARIKILFTFRTYKLVGPKSPLITSSEECGRFVPLRSITYFPCYTCGSQCGSHLDRPYDYTKSSTASVVQCRDKNCFCDTASCCAADSVSF